MGPELQLAYYFQGGCSRSFEGPFAGGETRKALAIAGGRRILMFRC